MLAPWRLLNLSNRQVRGTRVFTHPAVTPNVRNQAHLARDEEL
jgi:hypothetical protein